jgi:hypothetical protein
MTAVLSPAPSVSPRALGAGTLQVERADIRFTNITADRVGIEIAVVNVGQEPSEPTVAMIRAAPLGVFVPWQPLSVARVPSLAPGASYPVRLEAGVSSRPALGRFGRVPPRRLLTALAGDDDPESGPAPPSGSLPESLPADLFRLLGQANPHWAGNLNIFVQGREVERHMAQALRVYPGRTNLAMFVVGAADDSYRFTLHGDGPGWETALYDLSAAAQFALERRSNLLQGEWIRLSGMGLIILAMKPPSDCEQGVIEVRVCQRSTGRHAMVEFSLDPRAVGPGCFVV